MTEPLYIFVGAGLGGVLRYLLSTALQSFSSGWGFPVGTFAVNMLGCLLIGFLAQLSETKVVLAPELRLFIFVGILGGFTTFSSFGYETFQLMRDGEYLYAACNAVLQVVLGLLFVWIGVVLGRLL